MSRRPQLGGRLVPFLRRLQVIHFALAAGGATSVDLANRLGVNPRTITRDVNLLRDEFHAPVERTNRGIGYYAPWKLPFSVPDSDLPFFPEKT
jgi:hypothetical protein